MKRPFLTIARIGRELCDYTPNLRMTMLDEALFERVIHWAAAELGEERVLTARRRFEQATGPIDEGAPDFDSRMAHFFEGWLRDEQDGPSLLVRYVRAVSPPRIAQEQLAALQVAAQPAELLDRLAADMHEAARDDYTRI